MGSPAIFNGNYVKMLKNALRFGALAADPSSPAAGDMYYNSVSNLFKFYNGSAWVTVANAAAVTTNWQTYTPTFTGFGTVTVLKAIWRQVGQNYDVWATFTTGTPTAVIAQMTLPNSGVSSSSLVYNLPIGAGSAEPCGTFYRNQGDAFADHIVLIRQSSSFVTFGLYGPSTSSMLEENGNTISITSETITVRFSVPIQGL